MKKLATATAIITLSGCQATSLDNVVADLTTSKPVALSVHLDHHYESYVGKL
ncbi:hypothetical protein [Vibrio fortis]|uniref:hypothetical protein n=1 Tax=Vibrio fortis TaxID=212667 RepID=UPI003EBA0F15